jgi:D-alanyl-D-alanine carboxypeptidase (penicillin-binding protein 5/6)
MRRGICLSVIFLILFSFAAFSSAETMQPAYCIRPYQSDRVIAESRSEEWMNVAGMTKLPAVLTLCLAFDKGLIDPNAAVTVSSKAASIGGPSAYLEKGESVPASELMKAAVMISAGDAICALYEHAFGSEEVFLNNIHLVMKNAGVNKQLPDCFGTYMTFSCRELILLGEAALGSPTFMKYCSQKYAVLEHASGRKTELATANKLLTTLNGCIGLFTGSSKADGYCGVFAVRRGDTTYLCAVIGAPSSKDRFNLASKLSEEAFANYRYISLCSKDEPLIEQYPVEGGDIDAIDLYVKEDCGLLMQKADGAIQKRVDLPDVLPAPLDPDYAVGTVSFYDSSGTVLCELALYPGGSVLATGFRQTLYRIVKMFLSDG